MGGRGGSPDNLALPEPGGGRRGASPACPFTLALFLPPSPRPPSRREGGDLKFSYARGFAPCIPGVKSLTALTNSAVLVSGGKLAMEPGMSLRS